MTPERTSLRLFVGNLPYGWNEAKVKKLFETFGEVYWVSLIKDPHSLRPRGFGFVEMAEDDARSAIDTLDGQKQGGRILRVNIARPKPHRTGEDD